MRAGRAALKNRELSFRTEKRCASAENPDPPAAQSARKAGPIIRRDICVRALVIGRLSMCFCGKMKGGPAEEYTGPARDVIDAVANRRAPASSIDRRRLYREPAADDQWCGAARCVALQRSLVKEPNSTTSPADARQIAPGVRLHSLAAKCRAASSLENSPPTLPSRSCTTHQP